MTLQGICAPGKRTCWHASSGAQKREDAAVLCLYAEQGLEGRKGAAAMIRRTHMVLSELLKKLQFPHLGGGVSQVQAHLMYLCFPLVTTLLCRSEASFAKPVALGRLTLSDLPCLSRDQTTKQVLVGESLYILA